MPDAKIGLDLSLIVQGLVGGLLLLGFRSLQKSLREIRDHLAEINGRTRTLEEWKKGHEQLTSERMQAIKSMFEDAWMAIEKLRDRG